LGGLISLRNLLPTVDTYRTCCFFAPTCCLLAKQVMLYNEGMENYIDSLEENGFAIVSEALDAETISHLCEELRSIHVNEAVSRHKETAFGIRNLLNVIPAFKDFASSRIIRKLIEPIAGKEAKVVRAIFFDKTPEANWKVAWHQDLTIAVCEKREVEGFGRWSVKAGVPHVQPPASILEEILTLRIHLDEVDESNGALKVIPGSHKYGRLSFESISKLKGENGIVSCSVSKGGLMLMRPLLLHASSVASDAAHRRVIHLEFSSSELPRELKWYGS
jgi:ectoine hydroxylase-related dioxygenase (phytanoyl-CoA dioxygenase family)